MVTIDGWGINEKERVVLLIFVYIRLRFGFILRISFVFYV